MGQLEQRAKGYSNKTRLQRAVLAAAERIADLTTEALAGSIYKMYKLIDRNERRRKYRSVLAARDRMMAHGFLKRAGKYLELTEKGERTLREWERREYKIPCPKHWDGKWRILIFDIPETRKKLREKLRLTLRAIGFYRLQDSVWIYPHDCEDFITLLKADFKIGKDLLYLIAEGVENDSRIRDHFGVYAQ
ncbi:MAG: phenylacetic acid degradation operon negative regulatory protein [Parcubacteria group bacterium Greene0416_79]|nr:MAG: phenylacetic acid degradation operon negative regulatory protein [Parcubacteria group bacterium Greene0416_79]